MPSYTSNNILVSEGEGTYHCMMRRRRQAGRDQSDSFDGGSNDQLQDRICDWLRQWADIPGIDILGFAITADSVHLVVRTRRPSIQKSLSGLPVWDAGPQGGVGQTDQP
jgi:hypothetical protein